MPKVLADNFLLPVPFPINVNQNCNRTRPSDFLAVAERATITNYGDSFHMEDANYKGTTVFKEGRTRRESDWLEIMKAGEIDSCSPAFIISNQQNVQFSMSEELMLNLCISLNTSCRIASHLLETVSALRLDVVVITLSVALACRARANVAALKPSRSKDDEARRE